MRAFFLSALISFAAIVPAWASDAPSEIVIKDSSGVVRSISQVEEPSNLEFVVSDGSGMPADGAPITLKNELTGEELQVVSAGGHAVFEGIPPGTYVVYSSSANITFTSVIVSTSSGTILGAGTGTLLAIGGGGAAVAGGTYAITRSDNDNDDELSPSS